MYRNNMYNCSLRHIEYYAFGSAMKERTARFGVTYKYGFNNQEKEGELGEYYSFEYRVHDARLGRFLSVDPLANQYSGNTTYSFVLNSPILNKEKFGAYVMPTNNVEKASFYNDVIKNVFCNLDNYPFLKTCVSEYINSTTKNIYIKFHSTCVQCANCKTPTNQERKDGITPHYNSELLEAAVAFVPKENNPTEINKNNFTMLINSYQTYVTTVTGNYIYTVEMASKASIFVTLIHEMKHVQLGYKNLNDEKGLNKADHEDIAKDINKMRDDLLKYCKLNSIKLGDNEIEESENAEFLCWSGLEKTKAFETKFGTESSRTNDQKKLYDKFKAANKIFGFDQYTFDLNTEEGLKNYNDFVLKHANDSATCVDEKVNTTNHLGECPNNSNDGNR